MGFDFDKLNELSNDRSNEVIKKAEYLEKNRDWLRVSRTIALSIRYYLRKANMKQNVLAEKLGVSPAYIGKLLKGNENLTLETICRIQNIIGKDLITAHRPYEYKTSIQPVYIKALDFHNSITEYKHVTKVVKYSPADYAA